jgi:hypothetical protein
MPGFAGEFRLPFDGGNFVLEKLSPTFSDVFDELMKQIRTGGVFHGALCVAPPGKNPIEINETSGLTAARAKFPRKFVKIPKFRRKIAW